MQTHLGYVVDPRQVQLESRGREGAAVPDGDDGLLFVLHSSTDTHTQQGVGGGRGGLLTLVQTSLWLHQAH